MQTHIFHPLCLRLKSDTPLQSNWVSDPRAVAKCKQACVWLVAYARMKMQAFSLEAWCKLCVELLDILVRSL